MNRAGISDTGRFHWPLMSHNTARADLDELIRYLSAEDPRLTQSHQVRAFEEEWSAWLGVKYSVLVNSGSSANLITMAALREMAGPGDVLVPPLTWVSDIASVLHCGFQPVFVDINPRTLGMDNDQVLQKITPHTKAVFITHVLGYNALTPRLVEELAARGIPLVEDVCESHGATMDGQKLGTLGLASNFSFYYAHHLSTIEGGMVCTNDRRLYEMLRMFRSHGLVRESLDDELKRCYAARHPDLTPDFIFAFPAYNVRSTEINAVLGRSQLKSLDANNAVRRRNLDLFLSHLDSAKYRTDFETAGSCNYALTLILREADVALRDRVEHTLRDLDVEFRRGTSGGGNQLRQPYLRQLLGDQECLKYPHVEHIHFFGFYLGNYPTLETENITRLCAKLNEL